MKYISITKNGIPKPPFLAIEYHYDTVANCYVFKLENDETIIHSNENIEIKVETKEAYEKRQFDLSEAILRRWQEQEKKRKRFWSRF